MKVLSIKKPSSLFTLLFVGFFIFLFGFTHQAQASVSCNIGVSTDDNAGSASITGGVHENNPGRDIDYTTSIIYGPGGDSGYSSGDNDAGSIYNVSGLDTGDYVGYIQGTGYTNPDGDSSDCYNAITFHIQRPAQCSPTDATLGGWSDCSASCGGGTQTRTCNGSASCGGTDYCAGQALSQSCNTQSCAPPPLYRWTGGCGSCIQDNVNCTLENTANCTTDPSCTPVTCIPPVYGCTNPAALNYNPAANHDDGSCNFCVANTGSACSGSTSSPNSCGDTNPGGSGSIQCNGSCSASNGSTPAERPGYGNSCSSSGNACGQTNSGSIDCNGNCTASTPSNNLCPVPSASIAPDNSPIDWNTSTVIRWSSANASSCSISPTGWTGLSGAQGTGNLTTSQIYNIQCTSPYGLGNVSEFANVIVRPPVPVASSVTYSPPNYCSSGPGGFVAWSYSDPSGSTQTAYEVLIGGYDSGKLISSSHVFAIPNGAIAFANTYNARVRVWNTYDSPSPYSGASSNWTTPPYAWPSILSPNQFTWTPRHPGQNSAVPFTDHAVFGGGSVNGRSWSWNLGDGATSTQQSPTHTYTNTGDYTVTETVMDAAGQTCSLSQALNIQKPIPGVKEVAPK